MNIHPDYCKPEQRILNSQYFTKNKTLAVVLLLQCFRKHSSIRRLTSQCVYNTAGIVINLVPTAYWLLKYSVYGKF